MRLVSFFLERQVRRRRGDGRFGRRAFVIPGSGSAQTDSCSDERRQPHRNHPGAASSTRCPGPGIQAAGTLTVRFPVGGATAVLVNVTADSDATAPTFITVWPADQPRPSTSLIDPAPGRVTSGSILVPIDANQQASFYNDAGSVSLIVDFEGYLVPAAPLKPEFGYDSRTGPA